MTTVGDDLTTIQRFLRDSTGAVWPRAELLLWYNDGVRRLLTESHGVRRFTVLHLPPRYTMSIGFSWERRHVLRGSHRQFTFGGPTGSRQVTTLWELEEASSAIDPSTSAYPCVTQLWELGYINGGTDHPYRFALPRDHDRLKAMWFDHRAMTAVPSRILDSLETAWNRSAGAPWAWLPGYGEARSFEVYQIHPTYSDDYTYQYDSPQAPWGQPRRLSGGRTYTHTGGEGTWGFVYTTQADAAHLSTHRFVGGGTGMRLTGEPTPNPGGQYQSVFVWEQERQAGLTTFTAAGTMGAYPWEAAYGATNVSGLPLGLLRRLSSPERQYMAWLDWVTPLGIMRFLASSTENLLLHEAVIPDVPDLLEEETPGILPPQLQKYLRYWTLYCCFARTGEGFRPDLAAHWKVRYERGVALLRKLGDVSFADMKHQRESHGREERRGYRRGAPFPAEHGVAGVR